MPFVWEDFAKQVSVGVKEWIVDGENGESIKISGRADHFNT